MNYITLASTASAKKVGAQSPMKMPKRSCALFSGFTFLDIPYENGANDRNETEWR